jgi:predicted nucleotidyltransferase
MDPHAVERVARRHGIALLVRFGSTATGRTHARSDCDLGVLLDRAPETFAAHAELIGDLQGLVQGREVDVTVINHADPLLLRQVVEGGQLVFGSPRRFAELRILAFKRYQDHRRYFAMEREYVERKVVGVEP